MQNDIKKLRELAKRIMEIANHPAQKERKNLWRKHNSFKGVLPLINVRNFPMWEEMFDNSILTCQDFFFRNYEKEMYTLKFRDTLGYDFTLEPWITVNAVFDPPVQNRWGVTVPPEVGGSAVSAFKPIIVNEEDFEKLVVPRHKVNEEATRQRYEKLSEAIGDIIPVYVKRSSVFDMWTGDISTDISKIRGMEQIMWDAYDRPELFHRLLAFMRDGILKVHDEAEKAGDFSLADHENQGMTYAEELQDPNPNIKGVNRKELWRYMSSQEYDTFGPGMFNEFLLKYQMPILEKFGLVSYGCCEDLTRKIDYLRKIPNLRRISVTPFADVRKCAEQIGKDYILSWRPHPSDMISRGLDEDFVRKYMRKHFEIFKENSNHFDITLKDVITMNRQPENLSRWIHIVREEIDRAF